MRRCATVALLLALVSGGCASTYHVQACQTPEQEIRYDGGYPTLTSNKVNSVVMRPVYTPLEGKLMFYIAVANLTGRSFVLSQDIVTASSDDCQLKLWPRREIVKKIESEAKWATFWIALGAACDSYSASQPSETTSSGTFSGYGYGGSVSGTYSGTSSTSDPAATAAAQAAIQAQASQNLATVASVAGMKTVSVEGILTMETVDPGHYFGGYLLVDVPRHTGSSPKPVTFRVSPPGDEHVFEFTVTKE